MTAAKALCAARTAGVRITVCGDDLLLAASSEPPAAVLDLIVQQKAAIVRLLRRESRDWSAEDWRAFFYERAGIAEFDSGLSRSQAEFDAFEFCIAEWLNRNRLCSPPGRCGHCGGGDRANEPLVPFGVEPTGHSWLHLLCWATWQAARNTEAVVALEAMGIGRATPRKNGN